MDRYIHVKSVDVSISELTVEGGNATTDDYTLSSKQVVFKAGQSQATVDLTLKNDLTYEKIETLIIRLHEPQGALVGNPSSATVYIFDDEDGKETPQIQKANHSKFEKNIPHHNMVINHILCDK